MKVTRPGSNQCLSYDESHMVDCVVYTIFYLRDARAAPARHTEARLYAHNNPRRTSWRTIVPPSTQKPCRFLSWTIFALPPADKAAADAPLFCMRISPTIQPLLPMSLPTPSGQRSWFLRRAVAELHCMREFGRQSAGKHGALRGAEGSNASRRPENLFDSIRDALFCYMCVCQCSGTMAARERPQDDGGGGWAIGPNRALRNGSPPPVARLDYRSTSGGE